MAAQAIFLAVLANRQGWSSEETDTGWTDNFHSKEGIFAVRVDAENRRVLLLRADDHAVSPAQLLRLRLTRAGGAPVLVSLRPAASAGSPRKYAAELSQGWDAMADSAELEASLDGKLWQSVGVFRRPRP